MYEFLQETVENNMTRDGHEASRRKRRSATSIGCFAADDFDAYPVVRGDTLVGMVSKLDALKVFGLSQDHILPRLQGRHGDDGRRDHDQRRHRGRAAKPNCSACWS